MDARYKSIRTIVSAVLALALTGVLLWGILDAGGAAASANALATVGR